MVEIGRKGLALIVVAFTLGAIVFAPLGPLTEIELFIGMGAVVTELLTNVNLGLFLDVVGSVTEGLGGITMITELGQIAAQILAALSVPPLLKWILAGLLAGGGAQALRTRMT